MKDKTILCVLILIYVSLFITFYPPFYTTRDESNFIRLAFFFREGKIFVTDSQYQLSFGRFEGAYYPYFIGQSIMLLPFTFLGWNAAFLLGMVLHIIASIIFYRIVVEKQKKSIFYIALFLFFPYFIYYSTTLFSDFSAGVLALLAFYFYLSKDRKQNILSGALFGFVCVVKYTNILIFIPFFVYTLLKNRKKLLYLLAGLLPFAAFILVYNTLIFGGLFESPHAGIEVLGTGESSVTAFSPANYLVYLPFIIFRLLIIYPLMFFAPFFYRKEGRWEILGAYLLFLLFFGARFQSGYGFGLGPATLTRYILPVMPLILLTYSDFVGRIIEKAKPIKKIFKPAAVLVSIVLIAGSLVILSGQHQYLSQQYDVSAKIHSSTLNNSLIIGERDIARYLMEPFGMRRYLETYTYIDFSEFIDNNTFIVHKKFPEGVATGFLLNFSKTTENLIAQMNVTLVEEEDYQPIEGLIKSRPFKLQIFKVD